MRKVINKMKKNIRVALLGNPNSGKTTLFNSLTGSTAYVGNWPGVTVEKKSGTYYFKGKGKDREGIDIIDLPGIYSLSPYTPEEVISRNYILKENPDVVINVIDATNLERNLYMTTQLLEIDVPVVLAVNMTDALAESGKTIDYAKLKEKLKIPVVPISALEEKGLDNLMKVTKVEANKKREAYSVITDKKIEKVTEIYKKYKIANPLFHAIKALEKDEIEESENKEAYADVQSLMAQDKEDYEAVIADLRYQFLTPLCAEISTKLHKSEKEKWTKSDRIDQVLTHKIFGMLIMIVALFFVFHFTFSGDLLFLNAFGVNFGEGYEGFLSIMVGGEEYRPFAGLIYTDGGINSIGEFFHVLAGDNETGILGLISLGIKALLLKWNAPEWVVGFFYDGLLNGVTAVLGFVPQIMILYTFFSIMEDSGYMARIAFMLDRIFRKFGVSGRAFIPMIMGFGCAIPAMINTRTLATEKERIKTIRVIPFFTCGAKAEFIAIIAAAIAAAVGVDAGLFTFSMYMLGILVAIVSVIVMNKTTQREKVPPFIMELPTYRTPQLKALTRHVYNKGKHFVIKAFTIILASTIVIWLLANFGWDWQMVDENGTGSILQSLGSFIQPLFTPLGFGVQAGEHGWTLTVASIQGIVAKENVTATAETLASIIDVDGFTGIVEAIGLSNAAVVAFSVFNLLTIPCFAAIATAKGELSNRKVYRWTIAYWFLLSYGLGALTYVSFAYVWTLAITIPVIALLIALLIIYDRHKKKQELLLENE